MSFFFIGVKELQPYFKEDKGEKEGGKKTPKKRDNFLASVCLQWTKNNKRPVDLWPRQNS